VANFDQPVCRGHDTVAVACAGLFPLLHTGRPWLAYWLFPYPNTMGIWPQFRSPLMWDVFAVSTYATVSALFWFIGLIPDFATLRDRRAEQDVEDIVWARCDGLAWERPALAPLRKYLSVACGPCNASGAIGSHDRQF